MTSVGRLTQDQPKLLLSIRTIAEFHLARTCGVEIIDFKEPTRGPLAPAPVSLWSEVARWTENRVSCLGSDRSSNASNGPTQPLLSAALGEWDQATTLAARVPPSFRFAKAGPAACRTLTRWRETQRVLRDRLPPTVNLVAVAYADHSLANAPPPHELFAAASEMGIKTWLLDTWEKRGSTALKCLGLQALVEIQSLAANCGASWVLAGSLRLHHACYLIERGVVPHRFGIRGDACEGDRTGEISVRRVKRWTHWLTSLSQPGLPVAGEGS